MISCLLYTSIDREIAEAKAAQQPTLDPTAEPVVTILFTESPDLEMGQQMPLHEADALFARLDAEHRGGGYYDKTDFRIDFTFQGEPHKMCIRDRYRSSVSRSEQNGLFSLCLPGM